MKRPVVEGNRWRLDCILKRKAVSELQLHLHPAPTLPGGRTGAGTLPPVILVEMRAKASHQMALQNHVLICFPSLGLEELRGSRVNPLIAPGLVHFSLTLQLPQFLRGQSLGLQLPQFLVGQRPGAVHTLHVIYVISRYREG